MNKADARTAAAAARTLAYSAIFHFPLTANEVANRLIGNGPVLPTAVGQALAAGRRRGWWRQRAGYYFLPHFSYRRRHRGWLESRRKMRRAEKLSRHWKPLGKIRLLAVTGSVAAMNAYAKDDIDILVIVSPAKLWQTRLEAEWQLRRHRLPRRPANLPMQRGKAVNDKICPNVWLAADGLRLPESERNLFVAEEIMQMKIIFDKDNLYRHFLATNADWLSHYLASWLALTGVKFQQPRAAQSLSWREKLAFWGQKLYMARHRRREIIASRQAFFHPYRRDRIFLRRYRRILQDLNLPSEIRNLALSIAS